MLNQMPFVVAATVFTLSTAIPASAQSTKATDLKLEIVRGIDRSSRYAVPVVKLDVSEFISRQKWKFQLIDKVDYSERELYSEFISKIDDKLKSYIKDISYYKVEKINKNTNNKHDNLVVGVEIKKNIVYLLIDQHNPIHQDDELLVSFRPPTIKVPRSVFVDSNEAYVEDGIEVNKGNVEVQQTILVKGFYSQSLGIQAETSAVKVGLVPLPPDPKNQQGLPGTPNPGAIPSSLPWYLNSEGLSSSKKTGDQGDVVRLNLKIPSFISDTEYKIVPFFNKYKYGFSIGFDSQLSTNIRDPETFIKVPIRLERNLKPYRDKETAAKTTFLHRKEGLILRHEASVGVTQDFFENFLLKRKGSSSEQGIFQFTVSPVILTHERSFNVPWKGSIGKWFLPGDMKLELSPADVSVDKYALTQLSTGVQKYVYLGLDAAAPRTSFNANLDLLQFKLPTRVIPQSSQVSPTDEKGVLRFGFTGWYFWGRSRNELAQIAYAKLANSRAPLDLPRMERGLYSTKWSLFFPSGKDGKFVEVSYTDGYPGKRGFYDPTIRILRSFSFTLVDSF